MKKYPVLAFVAAALLAGGVFFLRGCPGPGPGPGPTPTPSKLKVLIVYESATLSTLPKEQLAVLRGAEVTDYLNTHCGTGPDGKTKDFLITDKDVDLSAFGPWYVEALKKAEKLPWVAIGNEKGNSYAGPLPATVADTLTLLKKFGG